jgi:type IV pilus assembly protein PilN
MVRINLLPVRVSKKKEAGQQQLALFAVILAVGLVGNYLWQSSRAAELKARQQKLARTREDIAQLERIIGEVRDIKEQQQALEQKLGVLERLKAGRSGPVHMLDELATITPKQLWLSKVEEKGGAVTFSGSALSIDDVSAFMSALKTSKYFSGVELRKTAAVAPTSGGGAPVAADRLVTFEISAAVSYAAPSGDAAPKGKG